MNAQLKSNEINELETTYRELSETELLALGEITLLNCPPSVEPLVQQAVKELTESLREIRNIKQTIEKCLGFIPRTIDA